MEDEALINKYRPRSFDEVVGQAAVVRSLKKALEKGASRTFLFSGEPGTGKTTLARLVAEAAGCPASERLEIDGATNTGIDDMRAITGSLAYKPLGDAKVKAVIVDEMQALSKAAVTSLLKILEEPPAHVVWILCTSEPKRIPSAIVTRATHFALKPVPFDGLVELLERVVQAEGLAVSEEVVDLCAQEAAGSPRQALANLSVCLGVKGPSEARELLRAAVGSEEAIALARLLMKRAAWGEAQKVLVGLAEVNPESVRHTVRAYFTKVALTATSEAQAGRALEVLDAFSEPFHPQDGASPLVLATGKVLLA